MHDGVSSELIYLSVGEGTGTYTYGDDYQRGGFRYLTVAADSTDSIELTGLSTNFAAAPVNDVQAHTGYFHCVRIMQRVPFRWNLANKRSV